MVLPSGSVQVAVAGGLGRLLLSDWHDACVASKLRLRQIPPIIAIFFCICSSPLKMSPPAQQALNPIYSLSATANAPGGEKMAGAKMFTFLYTQNIFVLA